MEHDGTAERSNEYGNSGYSRIDPNRSLTSEINQMVSFDFIYDLVAPHYPANGRPSVDPASMFKMLLVGYLYGIKSGRRLVQEIQLNIAYRWFCGIWNGSKNC